MFIRQKSKKSNFFQFFTTLLLIIFENQWRFQDTSLVFSSDVLFLDIITNQIRIWTFNIVF